MSGLLTETSEQRVRSLAISLREQGAPGTLDEVAARVRRGALLSLEPLPCHFRFFGLHPCELPAGHDGAHTMRTGD